MWHIWGKNGSAQMVLVRKLERLWCRKKKKEKRK
jgi:hypothetical protein